MSNLLKISLRDLETGDINEFTQEVVTLKDYRSALKLRDKLNEENVDENELVDEFVNFVVEVYKGIVSFQQVIDGVDPNDLLEIISTHINRCLGK